MPGGLAAIPQPLDSVVWSGMRLGAAIAQLFVWGPPEQCGFSHLQRG